MRKRTRLFLGLALVWVAAVAWAAGSSVEDLIKSPAKFDEKTVTVKGTVATFVQKTSKKGNPYVVFKLKGKSEQVNVYVRGKLTKPIKDGDVVEVTGVFRKEKKVMDFTVKNEIDATPKEGEKFGVKQVPGKKTSKG